MYSYDDSPYTILGIPENANQKTIVDKVGMLQAQLQSSIEMTTILIEEIQQSSLFEFREFAEEINNGIKKDDPQYDGLLKQTLNALTKPVENSDLPSSRSR